MTGALAGRAVGAAGPKGEAIAQAALRLFLRDGYERTSVDAIAAEAGVSKRTIYNRYTDKENLFRSVLQDMFTGSMAAFARMADAHLTDVTDVRVVPRATDFHCLGTEMLSFTPTTGDPVVFVKVTVDSCDVPCENVWSPGGVAVAEAGVRLSCCTAYLAATMLA